MTSTPAGKSPSNPVPCPSSNQSGASSAPNFSDSQRRPSQAPAPSSHGTPRRNQAARRQHRNQHRHAQVLEDVARTLDAELDMADKMPPVFAVRRSTAGRRRGQTDITHLLNYTVNPSRGFYDHPPPPYRSPNAGRYPTYGPGSGHHAVDKARFIHANFRFVVSPAGRFEAQASDADEHFEWADVMQVIASSESQAASCPICLSDPVAPRMARCGHVFCLHCLIQYLHTSENDDDGHPKPAGSARWRKCPLCEDAIYRSETRPLRYYAGQESPLPRVGDDVVLRLMARRADSTLALPLESGADGPLASKEIPWYFAANVLDYARAMRGTGDYMADQFDAEVRALEKLEHEDRLLYGTDDKWTRKAVRAVAAQKEELAGVATNEEARQLDRLEKGSRGKGRCTVPDFFFYASQPHLYLSPLDIRILKTKYGAFSQFPSTLLPRVDHISTGHVVDDALRKRARYLSHLPHGCVISFLECDWTDVVSTDILDRFSPDIERRRRRNGESATQTDRTRRESERLVDEELRIAAGIVGSSSASSARAFGDPAFRSPLDDDAGAASDVDYPDANDARNGPRSGFGPLADLSTSRTVWGTPSVAAAAASGPEDAEPANEVREVDDGWLRGDALEGVADVSAQMEALVMDAEAGGGRAAVAALESAGKKKKKKSKITLMSTGGRRGT